MRHLAWKIGAGIVFASVLAGCSAGAPGMPIEVKAGPGIEFTTKSITLTKGQKVALTMNNIDDSSLHDFTVDQIPAKDVKASGGASHNMNDMNRKGPTLHVAANPGKSANIQFTPTEAGEYSFYCTVPGHREGGMTGIITVKPT
jgi:uncharacterized cupredoxin-like copper-binding protein